MNTCRERLGALGALAVLTATLAGQSTDAPQRAPGEDLYPIRQQLADQPMKPWKQGFMNRAGEEVIEPRWTQVRPFREGLARVAERGDWGWIDPAGEVVIEPRYGWATDFSEGLAQVLVRRVEGDEVELETAFVDKLGRFAFEARFDFVSGCESLFHGGLARVAQGGAWGFIDRKGELAIAPRFEAAGDFVEGRAAVQLEGKWGYVDLAGKLVVEPRFDFAGDFSEGLAWVDQGGHAGAVGRDGAWVIEPRFDAILPHDAPDAEFSEGLARVGLEGALGFVDRTGELVIEPRFAAAGSFHEERAWVMVGRSTGYVDPAGRLVIEPRFVAGGDFRGGLAFVTRDGNGDRFAYVDREGQVVWESHAPSVDWRQGPP